MASAKVEASEKSARPGKAGGKRVAKGAAGNADARADAKAGTVSKGEFARSINVTPGRVSQYIAAGKLYGDALVGEGRAARIRPEVAREQLVKTLDPSQRLGGNGLRAVPSPQKEELPLDSEATPAEAPEQPAPDDARSTVVDEVAAERLRQMRIKTAQAERAEALEAGRYMLTEEARREMGRAVAEAFKVMDQGIREMSNALAAELGVNQRDAHQVMAKAFREVRARAATGFRAEAEASPTMVADAGDGEDWKAAS